MQGFFIILAVHFYMKNFLARINWRQIAVHTIAIWFVIYAFQTLFYLFHLKIIDAFNSSGGNTKEVLEKHGVTTADLSLFLVWKNFSGPIGLLFAFFLSLFISIRRKWFWVNSILSFVLAILLFRANLWDYTRHLFYYPGRLFSNSIIKILTNGTLLLAIGLLLFFSKPITRFISGRSKTE